MKILFWFTVILLVVLTIISRIRSKINRQYKPDNTFPIIGLVVSVSSLALILLSNYFSDEKLDFTKLIFPILFSFLFIDHIRRNNLNR
ncbi:MAG TPA: hypothetical protein PKD51_12395 [Saprospiraceae bacterium]|nr:hypothetical protein [Saprospiraceae bacterium]